MSSKKAMKQAQKQFYAKHKSNISIYNVDYPKMISMLYEKFSKDSVKIIFYETLNHDPYAYVYSVYNILGEIPPKINNSKIVNKKLSTMSLIACIIFGKFFIGSNNFDGNIVFFSVLKEAVRFF